jgi:ketosteroid isomerase-like protein
MLALSDFDQMGIVVDWVDACRKGDLATLLELYADDAQVECTCNGSRRHRGRRELESYWGPRLSAFSSASFALEEINPVPDGVDLEYSVAGALRIRASFRFSTEGKIDSMLFEPARQTAHLGCAC